MGNDKLKKLMNGNTILVCAHCKAISADIRDDPQAWNEWQVVPMDQCVCPACIQAVSGRQKQVTIIESQARGKRMATLGPIE